MRTLIVGAGQVGRLTAGRLAGALELGLHPVGFLDKEPIDNGRPLPLPVLGASDLEHVVSTYGIDCVVFTFSTAPHDVLLGLLDECDRLGVRALVVPRLFERVPSRVQLTHVGALPLLELMPTSTKSFQYAPQVRARPHRRAVPRPPPVADPDRRRARRRPLPRTADPLPAGARRP